MTIDIKILNKILANTIQQDIKRKIFYHDQIRFVPEMQDQLNIWKLIVISHTERMKEKKQVCNHLNWIKASNIEEYIY